MASEPSPKSQPLNPPRDQSPAPIALSSTQIPSANTASLPHRPADDKPSTSRPSTASTFIPAWRRPTTAGAEPSQHGRRQSVQFVPNSTSAGSRSSSAKPAIPASTSATSSKRRMSSPPPPAQFRPSVSFDTIENPDITNDFSLTLNRKHKAYEYSKRSRTFLCGTDTNEYSDTALEWLIDELVDDGDEVVCLRVVENESREAIRWAAGKGEKGYRDEALRFLDGIVKKNTEDKAISLVLEFAIGKVPDTIQQMIRIYEPAILVVGTRGRSLTGYQALLASGSVSKYCLQYSPVPVIVVRPSSKRESKKRKRLQDPTRTGYRDILDKSKDGTDRGGHLLDKQNRYSVTGADMGPLGHLTGAGDPNEEARRVAEAIGYHPGSTLAASSEHKRSSSLSRVSTARSNDSDLGSPKERLLKSPELRDLDSPEASDDENDPAGDDLHQEILRPEDEAAMLAYERAIKVREEEDEEAELRQQKEAEKAARGTARSRSRSRGRTTEQDDGGGAGALGLLAQLERGMR